MNASKILGSVVATILVSSLGTLVACSDSHDKQETVPTSQAVSAASVQIAILDANGAKIGTASGTMIAPQLVLTAAHNLAGQAKWSVTSADGKQVATSSRAMTYDWMSYQSDKAHPRRHDVGVIHLDTAIKLDAYPKLVTSAATDNVQATRIRGINGTFAKADVTLSKVQSSPNAWLGNAITGETLDTGGAVYNDQGILGVISGQGTTTGKLYIAQVSNLGSWLDAKVACAGGAQGVRTYVAPVVDKQVSDCTDGGTSSTTGSSGSSGNASSPSGSNGSGSDNGGTCSSNNDGHCSGAGCGTGGTNGTTGDDDDDNGSNGGSGSGANGSNGNGSGNGGTGGTNGTTGAGGDNGGTNGSSANGGNGSTGSGNGNGNGGTGGTNGTTGAGGDNGSTNGSSANGGNGSNGNGSGNGGNGGTNGTTGAGGDNGSVSGSNGSNGNGSGSTGGAGSNPNGGNNGEVCQGSDDNSDICPPEPTNCYGPTCGGGTPDAEIDFGNCACTISITVDVIVK